MGKVFENDDLTVKDAPLTGPLGGRELAFVQRERSVVAPTLDIDEVEELHTELGEWLRQVGRA